MIFVFSCSTKQKELNTQTKLDTITTKQKPVYEVVWQTDYVQIIAENTIDINKISYTKIKFEPFLSFNDFKTTSTFEGNKHPINFKNKLSKRFRTTLTKSYKNGKINFGGFYHFVDWGCGSPCQSGAIVDARDGKVYPVPSASLDYSYQKDSRMLIVNTPDSTGFYDDCSYCHPEIYVWNKEKKSLSKKSRVTFKFCLRN